MKNWSCWCQNGTIISWPANPVRLLIQLLTLLRMADYLSQCLAATNGIHINQLINNWSFNRHLTHVTGSVIITWIKLEYCWVNRILVAGCIRKLLKFIWHIKHVRTVGNFICFRLLGNGIYKVLYCHCIETMLLLILIMFFTVYISQEWCISHMVQASLWFSNGRFYPCHSGLPSTSLALKQSCNCPSANEVTLNNPEKINTCVSVSLRKYYSQTSNIRCSFVDSTIVDLVHLILDMLEEVWSVWYKTKFGSQNFGYQIW